MKLNTLSLGIIGLATTLATTNVAAEALDFSISDHAAKLLFSSSIPGNDLSWSIEGLHFEDNGSSANIIGAGAYVAGRSNASTARQTAGLGGKAIIVSAEGADTGSGFALGGYIRHTLRQANLISLRGEAFVAPNIIAFQGMSSYLEFSGRVEYQLLDQANIYLGYRHVRANLEFDNGFEGKYEFEDGVMAGVNILF